MLNRKSFSSVLLVQALVCAQILMPLPTLAAISNLPPLVKANVPPNVFYTLDDSGSMMFEVMPDTVRPTGISGTDGSRTDVFTYCGNNCWVVRTFPSPDDVYNTGTNGNYDSKLEAVVGFSDNITVARWRSAEVNKMYYDPKIRYEPWVDVASVTTADPYGNPMANADPAAAKYNPVTVSGMSTATLNLTVEQARTLHGNYWLKDAANDITDKPTWTINSASKTTFYPATYFQYNPSNLGSCTTSQLSCFKRIEIKASTTFPTKAPARSDCGGSVCTYNEEIINFANWFQYYRSRILSARAGSGRAFANQAATLRVGFGTINTTGTKVSNVSDDFDVTNKKAFLSTLYQAKIPAKGTPLRTAVDDIGQYFMNRTKTGPWQTKYNQGEVTDQLSCRQNYNILMTDGYWNGTGALSGRANNWDGNDGTTKTAADGSTYKYSASAPYKDGESDTLADIAMYYWVTDLRSDWPQAKKNVPLPRDGSNPAFWQHLVQYTVGLGVKGNLDPTTDLPLLTSGSKNWPAAATNQIDDLWHAALNSRGKFFSAGNPEAFADALNVALNEIAARSGDAAAVATSKSTLEAGLKLYTSTYQTADWSGRLEQKSVDENTGNLISPNDWDTDTKIGLPASRKIFTVASDDGKSGTEFNYTNLNSTHKGILTTAAAAYAPTYTVTGDDIVQYLKGERSKESKPFRTRKVLLGDLVNSDPQYVKEGKDGGYSLLPSDIKGKSTYAGYFRTNRLSRVPTVYVGSNDGMLHAFDATKSGTGGTERFAFIPKAVVPNLHELAKPNYVHRFYVDGTPNIADAAIGSNPDNPWKTVLLGTTGAGGKSVFALDVTDPNSFDQTKVLWERNSTTPSVDNDLGFTIGVAQMGVMRDGRWVGVFGNGFDSVNRKAFLYVVDLKSGDIIRKIDTGVGGSGAPNGLATPKLLLNADSTIAAAYAGDLQGNMWKFDFVTTGTSPSLVTTPGLAFGAGEALFTAVDTSRKQPITTQPQLFPHPDGGYIVVFATGKIFEDTDAATVDKETIYGIWDKKIPSRVTQSQLQEQTLAASGNFYTLSKNVVNWSSKRGWFITLKIKNGERVVTDPIILEDQVIITTLIPGNSSDLCVIDALSTTLQISPLAGSALGYKTIDTNKDGKVDASDTMVSGVQSSATFGTTVIRLGNRQIKVVQADARTGQIKSGTDDKRGMSDAIPVTRLWRQLIGRP